MALRQVYRELASTEPPPLRVVIKSYSSSFCKIFLQGTKELAFDEQVGLDLR